jgi:hypothetical protein
MHLASVVICDQRRLGRFGFFVERGMFFFWSNSKTYLNLPDKWPLNLFFLTQRIDLAVEALRRYLHQAMWG